MNTSSVHKKSEVAFDPWLVWVAFRRHWGWSLPLGFLLATLSALYVWYQFEPEFQATCFMEANRDFVIAQGLQNQSRDLARTERTLITHALVLDPVLADPKLRAAPSLSNPQTAERQIRDRLAVGNAGTDTQLTISYRDRDKVMAAKVCNAIAESYLKVREQLDEDRFEDVESWLAQPIEQWKRNVENLRLNLTQLSKDSNGIDPFKENIVFESQGSELQALGAKLSGLKAEEVELMARLSAIQASRGKPSLTYVPNPIEIADYISSDREVIKVRQKLSDLENRIRTIEQREQQNYYAIRYEELKAEVLEVEAQLTETEDSVRPRAIEYLEKLHVLETAAEQAEEEEEINFRLKNLQEARANYTKDYEAEKSRLQNMGGETAEIYFASQEYEQASEILTLLNNRLATLKTERGRGASVHTLAAATTPAWPIEEVPFKRILLAGGASFMLPFALALLLEFRFKRLTTAESIESNNLAPVMGEIARIPGGARSSRGHRLFEESIDALRANMLFKLEGVHTIVVTSAMPSEGKSSVASQLAISLAKASESSVLIIDADLRSPDQHELFGLDSTPGLCNLLAGKATFDECVNTSLGDLVHVLPAGRLDANPHNLLTKKNVEKLFAEARQRYQYIVVDTAPVLPAAESLSVTAAADGTLLCAMRDVSRTDHVRRTQRRLEAAGANVLGTVFSGVPSREYAYRYGDYRYARDRSQRNLEKS